MGKKFELLGNRNEPFQLKDLPGGEKKRFVKELSAGKTYLKTKEGMYVVFNKEQKQVTEDSRPGLEVEFHDDEEGILEVEFEQCEHWSGHPADMQHSKMG